MEGYMQKVDVVAALIGRFVKSGRPSDIVPFKGKFPLVRKYENDQYEEDIHNYDEIKDCPEKLQDVMYKGLTMYNIESNFKQYLRDQNISEDEFKAMSSDDKATELVRFFNGSSLSLDALRIN